MVIQEESSSYRWVVLSTFTLNYSLVLTAVITLGLFLPAISKELGLSPSQQGWLASSVLFANLIFSIPFNMLLSRFRPWRVASISFFAGSLFLFFGGWAPTFAVLLIARVGIGLIQLATQAPRTLVVLQWMPPNRIGAANGFMFSIVDIVIGVGSITIPLIMVAMGGWRNTMFIWGGIVLAAMLLWLLLGKDKFPEEYRRAVQPAGGTTIGNVLKYSEVWLIGLAVFGVLLGRAAFGNFWPTFVHNEYGISIATAGLVLGITAFGMAPTELGLALLSFFMNRKAAVLMACGLIQVATYFGLIMTSNLPLLFVLGLLNGATFGFFPILTTMIYQLPRIKPREVAVAISFMYTTLWGGGAIGPLVVGFVQEATGDLRLAMMITSFAPLTVLVSGLLLFLGTSREKAVESGWPPRPGLLKALSGALEMDEERLVSRVQKGDTITTIAQDQGVDLRRIQSKLGQYISNKRGITTADNSTLEGKLLNQLKERQ